MLSHRAVVRWSRPASRATINGVEANLRSLAVERLDVVNLRLLDAAQNGEPGDQGIDLDSQLAEMVSLRDDGKIGGIGISNVTHDQLRRANLAIVA